MVALNALLMTDAKAPAKQHAGPEPWTKDRVIDAFMQETGIGRKQVTVFVNSMVARVSKMVEDNETFWLPGTKWLNRHHATLVAAIPDHTESVEGSGHRGLEELIMPPTDGVLTITHDMVKHSAVQHCAVTVTRKSARLN